MATALLLLVYLERKEFQMDKKDFQTAIFCSGLVAGFFLAVSWVLISNDGEFSATVAGALLVAGMFAALAHHMRNRA